MVSINNTFGRHTAARYGLRRAARSLSNSVRGRILSSGTHTGILNQNDRSSPSSLGGSSCNTASRLSLSHQIQRVRRPSARAVLQSSEGKLSVSNLNTDQQLGVNNLSAIEQVSQDLGFIKLDEKFNDSVTGADRNSKTTVTTSKGTTTFGGGGSLTETIPVPSISNVTTCTGVMSGGNILVRNGLSLNENSSTNATSTKVTNPDSTPLFELLADGMPIGSSPRLPEHAFNFSVFNEGLVGPEMEFAPHLRSSFSKSKVMVEGATQTTPRNPGLTGSSDVVVVPELQQQKHWTDSQYVTNNSSVGPGPGAGQCQDSVSFADHNGGFFNSANIDSSAMPNNLILNNNLNSVNPVSEVNTVTAAASPPNLMPLNYNYISVAEHESLLLLCKQQTADDMESLAESQHRELIEKMTALLQAQDALQKKYFSLKDQKKSFVVKCSKLERLFGGMRAELERSEQEKRALEGERERLVGRIETLQRLENCGGNESEDRDDIRVRILNESSGVDSELLDVDERGNLNHDDVVNVSSNQIQIHCQNFQDQDLTPVQVVSHLIQKNLNPTTQGSPDSQHQDLPPNPSASPSYESSSATDSAVTGLQHATQAVLNAGLPTAEGLLSHVVNHHNNLNFNSALVTVN